MITVGPFITAMRAGAHDVTVSQKLAGLFIVILLGNFFTKNALIIKGFEKVRGYFVVCGRGGSGIDIERDAELLE